MFHWTSETTGPMVVPSLVGSPTDTASIDALAIALASSIFELGTSILVPALQDCPEFMHIPKASLPTASSRFASSRIIFADLPPSSCATRFTVGAAFFATSIPALVDPVNDIMSIPGWDDIYDPTVGPSPFTRLKTPAGTPASCIISAKIMAFRGATSDGFSTIVQPAAKAGATLQAIWLIGQFHGVIIPTTPIGSLTIRFFPCSSSN